MSDVSKGLTEDQRFRLKTSSNTRNFRRRNKLRGLCGCGRPRRNVLVHGRPALTCEICHTRVLINQGKLPKKSDVEEVPIVRSNAAIRLQIEPTPGLVCEWEIFCIRHDMTIMQAIEDAMELYMAVTEKAEREEQQVVEEHREFLMREAG